MGEFRNNDNQFGKLMMLVRQTEQKEQDPHDLEYLEWLRGKLEAILVESHQKKIDLDI